MSRVFILGMSPLPFENDRKVYGTGIRTWQFVLPLLKNGHKLCLVSYAIPSAYQDDFNSKFTGDFNYEGYSFEYNILKKDDFENIELLSDIFLKFEPDCIIGCTFYPSFMASKLLSHAGCNINGNNKNSSKENNIEQDKKNMGAKNRKEAYIPFWADLFGHVMAEAQARAYIDEDDSCLYHYWNGEYNILISADKFSCVSKRQKYALIGELGAVGRLNRFTQGYRFTTDIACGLLKKEYEHKKNVIRGKDKIDKDDFVVLWTGGYNTWTDIDTLFDGLTLAMKENPKIKFVSTGGEIPEQDIKTYPKFLDMINNSPYKERFIMKGWIAGEDVPNYYFEANAGINIDKDIYEVKLGSKNRILDWMRAGLCILSSNVCELTEIIETEKIGYTFKPGDPEDLAGKLLYLASNREEAKRAGLAGKKYGFSKFSFEKTTIKLQEWAEKPCFSPDRGKERKIFFDKEEALKNLNQITERQKKMIFERDRRISELEGIVEKSFIYKIYSYIKIIKRKLSG